MIKDRCCWVLHTIKRWPFVMGINSRPSNPLKKIPEIRLLHDKDYAERGKLRNDMHWSRYNDINFLAYNITRNVPKETQLNRQYPYPNCFISVLPWHSFSIAAVIKMLKTSLNEPVLKKSLSEPSCQAIMIIAWERRG